MPGRFFSLSQMVDSAFSKVIGNPQSLVSACSSYSLHVSLHPFEFLLSLLSPGQARPITLALAQNCHYTLFKGDSIGGFSPDPFTANINN